MDFPTAFRLLAAFALLASGCARETGAPAASPSRTFRCTAPEALPGSLPLPDSLRDAIAATDLPSSGSARTTCNRLALERSPFARRHAADPIDWRPWSARALDEAAALGRPILVLSGSAACPSCEELRRTSLGRRRFVRDVNRYFVPVLVDRDERPDVDAYLMLAVQVLTGGGGWPAVVFLTADARPFDAGSWGAAGTGDRSLGRMVEDVRRRIELGGGTIEERGELAIEKMERRASLDTKGPLPDARATMVTLGRYVAETYDRESGAFAPPPLFPRPPLIDFLVRAGRNDRDAAALQTATSALEKLRASPLFDPARGAFFRFAKEKGWRSPERVKPLADNSAIASAYFEAFAATSNPALLESGRRTVDALVRDFTLADGAFAASIDETADPPVRDERVFADANALAVSALVRAAAATGDSRYLDAAVAAAKILDVRLREGSFVNHCIAGGDRRCADGYLADQVFTAAAFLDLDEASAPGAGRWLDAARSIADALPGRFGHQGTGGFFQIQTASEPLPLRLKPALDTVVPSANSAAALLYTRLAARTADAAYSKEALRTFEAFAEVLELRPLALPSMVVALADYASAPPQLDPAPAVQP